MSGQNQGTSGRISSRIPSRKLLAVFLLLAGLFVIGVGAGLQASSQPAAEVRTIVTGGEIHGSNGLAFDDDGLLYIASAVGREIVVIDPLTGEIVERLGPEDGVQGPDDVTFGPNGVLYWTDILTGEVGRRDTDGVVAKQTVAPFVNPISMNADGRLFVAQAFVADGLFEIDPDLVDPPELILGTGDPFNHLNGFDFGPDGWLYAPQQQQARLVRINVDTQELEVITDEVEGACKFDSQGELFVGANDRIVHYDRDTDVITTVASVPEGTDNLAFNADDDLYTSNFKDGTIYQVYEDGSTRLVMEGGLIAPGGIAVLPNDTSGESIYVADFWTVREFDSATGKPGIAGRDFFFDSPFTAAPDGENLVLTSWFGNTVEIWSPATQTILDVDTFNVPVNAIRFQGDLIVAELGTGSVVRQAAGSKERTTLTDQVTVPSGLAATDDDLWVADWATGMIWQLVTDGVLEDPPKSVASALVTPEGLAVAEEGSLLVVESGAGRLSRVDLDTGEVSVLVEDLAIGLQGAPGWPPTWIFNGVAVGENGTAYVTGDVANVVYRIRFPPFEWALPVLFR